MVDINKLKSALDGYKQYFSSHWQDETYKGLHWSLMHSAFLLHIIMR